MKKMTLSSVVAAVAAIFSLANASAGTLTITSGPTFTPDTAFTDNTIQAEVISNPPGVMGDLVRISGGATVTPPATNIATVDIEGTYSANTDDTFSVAYAFTADLNFVGPVQYTVSGSVDVLGVPVDFSGSGEITNGLHQYEDEIEVPVSFPFPISGSFTGTLTLDFNQTVAPAAASGTLDIVIQQIDFQLAPTAATLPPPSQSQNISTRGDVETGDNVLIGGFIITGTEAKLVVLRAIGPSLAASGVTGVLADPVIELHDSTGALVATNDNWMDNSAEDQMILTDNNFAPTDDLESALVATLDPGLHTAVVRGVNDGTGIGLVEAYDLDTSTDGQLGNISTRGLVGTGENVLIGGFILGPETDGAASIVVRGLGPSLTDSGVSGALQDPNLEVHDANGDLIASNDNWMDNPDAQTIIDAGLAPPNDDESAVLVIPLPGAYTAIVSGVNDETGVGLVEVYNLQ